MQETMDSTGCAPDDLFKTSPDAIAPTRGAFIGRLQLLRTLGEGGMGVVYAAYSVRGS